MKIVALDNIKPGDKLAKPLFSNEGRVLLGRGVELTTRYISRLKSLGYYSVYISTAHDDIVEINDIIKDKTRAFAVSQVRKLYHFVEELDEDRKYIKFGDSVTSITNKIIDDINANNVIMADIISIKTLDDYTFQHSVNVCALATVFGMRMGFNGRELRDIAVASLLHDIGKMYTPREILLKPTELTEDEYKIVKEHANEGFSFILNQTNLGPKVAIVCYQHHEKWDGSGYPESIEGEEIQLYSRIVSVLDTYDALTSDRVFKGRISNIEAINTIVNKCKEQYDPDIIEVLKQAIALYPAGSELKLSTGEHAIVVKNNDEFANKPIIKLIADENGKEIEEGESIDLSTESGIEITECLTP